MEELMIIQKQWNEELGICESVRYYYYYCYHHHHHHHHHPNSLHHSTSAGSQENTDLTDQALRIHRSAKNLLTVQHVLIITAFCIRMYRAGR
jgi:hypothetical protein